MKTLYLLPLLLAASTFIGCTQDKCPRPLFTILDEPSRTEVDINCPFGWTAEGNMWLADRYIRQRSDKTMKEFSDSLICREASRNESQARIDFDQKVGLVSTYNQIVLISEGGSK